MVYGYQYEAPFTTPAFYSQYVSPGMRGVQRGAIGIRGILRGRGRGAAGSRGAGGTRGYTTATFAVRDGYKKHPVEGRLYDILPGMDLIPTNPVTLKPQSLKTTMQILDEMCQKNGWGTPIYQLHSAVHREGAGDMQLFLFKVTIPALASQNPNPFQPNKLCRSVEEAKSYAAEYVLAQLGLPVESAEITATPTSPYQGRPIYPNGAQTFAPALPIVTSASYVVTPGKVVQNPEYPGAYEYQTGYPTSQPPPVYGHQY